MENKKAFWDRLFKSSGLNYEKLYAKIYGETIIQHKERLLKDDRMKGFLFFEECWEKHRWSQDIINDFVKNKYMFFGFYAPYVAYAEKQIIDAGNIKGIDNEGFKDSLHKSIYKKLVGQSIQVLIRELAIAKKEDRLSGKDSEEQYYYFENHILTDSNYHEYLFGKYPVLFDVLMESTIYFCKYMKEIVENVGNNWNQIVEELGLKQKNNCIKSFDMNQGDTHQGGKSVCEIILNSGEILIYKPRNLNIDEGFSRLINWFNQNIHCPGYLELDATCQFRGKDFGISKYVEHRHCRKKEELENYYFRIGELLAILYVLDASDIHRENIIASGEYPILIDCETLFSPYSARCKEEGEYARNDLYRKVSTVQRIGILPFDIWGKENGAGYGGLDYSHGQLSPFKSIKIKNINTADVKVEYTYDILSAEKNTPVTETMALDPQVITEQVVKGYDLIIRWIVENKNVVIEKANEFFEDAIIRVLLKSTMIYDSTLEMSYHPDVLSDCLTRRIILLRNFIQTDVNTEIGMCECKDLLRGDIPMFHISYGGTELIWREQLFSDFYGDSAKKRLEIKIGELSEELILLQERIILESLANNEEIYEVDRTGLDCTKLSKVTEMLQWLAEMSEYLVNKSISFSDGYRAWIEKGYNERLNRFMQIAPLDYELYLGESGMALLFLNLYKLTGNREYLLLSQEIIKCPMLEADSLEISDTYNIGAFSGFSGRMYVLSKLYQETKEDTYLQYINKYLVLLKDSIEKDNNLDIIGGTAGLLMVLLSMLESGMPFIDKRIVETSVHKCVKHICEKCIFTDNGVIWVQQIEDKPRTYTGFSHGSMGILAALARYKCLYNTDKVDMFLAEGLKWMNSMYSVEDKNWYKDSDKCGVSYGWCHGASGILLGYTLIEKYCPGFMDNQTYVKYAKDITLRYGFGQNATLCHGDLGNLEILKLYGEVFSDKECLEIYQSGIPWEFENVVLKRWKGKSFRGRELVGLMVGLAGYGYSIIQYLLSDQSSCVLYLE